jgi:hypothetical protein
MIKISQSQHWYHKDGRPSHDSDLRDARKIGLLSSVTSIDKDMFKNFALDKYKLDQLSAAAFNNPVQPHESLADYAQRIYLISLEHSSDAASFGTKLHDVFDGKAKPEVVAEIQPFADKALAWHQENILEVISSEKTLVDLDIGVAGRMDQRVIHKVHGRVKLDFKSQGVKTNASGKKKPGFYESFIRQLSFYSIAEAKQEGLPMIDADPCLSVVIDSTEPSEPYCHLWPKEEMFAAYEDFVIATWSYYKKRDYWPCGRWDLCEQLKQTQNSNYRMRCRR